VPKPIKLPPHEFANRIKVYLRLNTIFLLNNKQSYRTSNMSISSFALICVANIQKPHQVRRKTNHGPDHMSMEKLIIITIQHKMKS
jgi:hypothetical protein